LFEDQGEKELQNIIGEATTNTPLEILGGSPTEVYRRAWENAIVRRTHTNYQALKPNNPYPYFYDRMRILTIKGVAERYVL
jgi:hypothetical protein